MKTKTIVKRNIAVPLLLAVLLAFSLFAAAMSARMPANANTGGSYYAISNPYENVDWGAWGQYRSALHTHTTNSDGAQSKSAMVIDHYNKNFDILAITDHDVLNANWTVGGGAMSSADRDAIEAGAYTRNGRTNPNGMIEVPFTNEVSRTDHINAFFTDVPAGAAGYDTNLINIAKKIGSAGGLSHLNHPGRFTGGATGGDSGAAASNNPAQIAKCVDLFKAEPTCVGMEIINKDDNESRSDRILWDNILKEMMPERPVWGFSNDDAHSTGAVGFAWNTHLMPALTADAFRTSTETGAFYGVTRIDRRENVSAMNLSNPTPEILGITVEGTVITITAKNTTAIEWIADGVKIATGASIDVSQNSGVNSYVRAHLKSSTGVAYTQPFGVAESFPAELEVENQSEFMNAAKLFNGKTGTIKLTSSFNWVGGTNNTSPDGVVKFDNGTNVTIKGDPANAYANSTITISNRTIFDLFGNAQLTLDGINIIGNRARYASYNSSIGANLGGHANYDYFIAASNSAKLTMIDSQVDITLASNICLTRFIDNTVFEAFDSVIKSSGNTLYSTDNNFRNVWLLRGNTHVTAGSSYRGTFVFYDNARHTGAINNSSRIIWFDNSSGTNVGTSNTQTDYRGSGINAAFDDGAVTLSKTGSAATSNNFVITRYTTDGTDPAASATAQDYTEPFLINNSVTVRAMLVHTGSVDNRFWLTANNYVDMGNYFGEVDGLIALINTIDADDVFASEDAILSARAIYDGFGARQKALVTNFTVFLTAEAELKAIKTAAKLPVLNIINGINGLPAEITLADGQTVDALIYAYLVLSPTQKADVENYSVLEAAAAKIAELRAEAEAVKSVWYTGAAAPSGALGKDGDFYMDVDSHKIYVKVFGAWAEINIKGDKGEDGKDGVDGQDGKDGVDGKDGKDGNDNNGNGNGNNGNGNSGNGNGNNGNGNKQSAIVDEANGASWFAILTGIVLSLGLLATVFIVFKKKGVFGK